MVKLWLVLIQTHRCFRTKVTLNQKQPTWGSSNCPNLSCQTDHVLVCEILVALQCVHQPDVGQLGHPHAVGDGAGRGGGRASEGALYHATRLPYHLHYFLVAVLVVRACSACSCERAVHVHVCVCVCVRRDSACTKPVPRVVHVVVLEGHARPHGQLLQQGVGRDLGRREGEGRSCL